ncbi:MULTISPECIES: DEAD/DEAH box helicase [unclassified Gordonia (in: high G+C Gram-positive bacteria)]
MGSTVSEDRVGAVSASGLHVLWRPGIGLAVWLDPAYSTPAGDQLPATSPHQTGTALPDAVSTLLAGKRFRRDIALIGPDGHRNFVSAMTLGTSSAVTLLDATRSLPVGGDVRWCRLILDGVRRFVDAGAVVPAVVDVAGETVARWQPIPTPSWRSWCTVVAAGAPQVLLDNGGASALGDLAAELTDFECRSRLAASIPRLGPVAPSTPVLASLVDGATVPPQARHPATRTAWSQWNSSAPQDDSTLIFRLHEPEDLPAPDDSFGEWEPDIAIAEPRWRLQVCRRAPDGHTEPVLPHRLDAHDLDQMTTELASAVRAFGELAQAEPDRTTLDFLLGTRAVEQLFAEGAAALGDAGFPVLLPRTIADVRPVLGVRATPVPGGGAPARMVGLREVREFEWRLSLGDDPEAVTLTDGDLDELSRQKGDLVRVRGVWMRAEGAALTRAAAFIRTQRALRATDQPADMGELFGLVVDGAGNAPVPVTSVEGLGWLDDIAAGGALRPAPLSPPAALATELRPYQLRGLDWLWYLSTLGVGGVLADDMGLGKTVQVIALLCRERESTPPGAVTEPTLIICPMSVVGNWFRELQHFAPHLRVVVHHGADRARGSEFGTRTDGVDVVLSTFAIATRDRGLLAGRSWRRLVVDEAQHVKNVNTAAAKALRSIPAAHRLALTGTPVENRLEDLRAVIDLVNPGMLGSASVFRARFAEPIERDRDPGALRRLTGLTRPFILRREKSDPTIITDLPEKTEITVRANLTVEQAALYRAIIDDLMAALRVKQQRAMRRRTVLAALTRLKQVCNHPAHYLGDGSAIMHREQHRSGKVELLGDMAATLVADGDRALVFTQFAVFGEMLSAWLGDLLETPIPLLHGGVTRTERDRIVGEFGSGHTGPPILVATLKAGGTGLNLTAANHVIHVDRWWNPAVEDQATDRAYRIGQHQHVHVRRFVCVGTLEERIDDMVAKKRELSRLTVAAGENWISDLGDDELFDLFRLRDEAVSE